MCAPRASAQRDALRDLWLARARAQNEWLEANGEWEEKYGEWEEEYAAWEEEYGDDEEFEEAADANDELEAQLEHAEDMLQEARCRERLRARLARVRTELAAVGGSHLSHGYDDSDDDPDLLASRY